MFLSAASEPSEVTLKYPEDANAHPLGSTLTALPADTTYDTSVPSVSKTSTQFVPSKEKSNVTLEPVIVAGNTIADNNKPSVLTPSELLASPDISIKAGFPIVLISSLL